MFDGADARAAFLDGRSPGYIHDIFAIRTDDRRAGQIDPLKFYSVIWLGGKEGHICLNTGMKTYPGNGNGLLYGLLFYIKHKSGKSANLSPIIRIIQSFPG